MATRLRATICAALCLAVAGGCKGKKKAASEKQPDPATREIANTAPAKPDDRALDRCIKGLTSAQSAGAGKQIVALMDECGAAQSGFGRIARADEAEKRRLLATTTDAVCNETVRREVITHGDRWLELAVKKCGASYYGLELEQIGFLSLEWFVVQRVGRYLETIRPLLSPKKIAAIDAAIAEDRWVLPIPTRLEGEYELPVASNLLLPMKPRGWIVVTRKAVRLATAPSATITASGAEVVDDPGTFPGVALTAKELGPMLTPESGNVNPGRAQWIHVDAPVIIADKKVASTRLAEVVAGVGRMGARLAVVGRDVFRLATLPAGFRVVADGRLGKDLLVIEMEQERMRIHFGGTREEVLQQAGDYDWIKLGLVIRTAAKFGVRRAAIAVRPWVTVEHVVNAANLLGQAGLREIALTQKGVELIKGSGKGISSSTGKTAAAPGIATPGGAEATGDMELSVIRRNVMRHRGRIRFCYDKHVKTTPGAKGNVVVSFTIASSGAVMNVRAQGFAPVDECVGKTIATIKFPKPRSGTVLVRYPFSFRSAK